MSVLLFIAACISSFGNDRKDLIASTFEFQRWLRDNVKPDDRQINLITWTNKSSSITNLIQLARDAQGKRFEDLVTSTETAGGVVVRQPHFMVFAATNNDRVALTFVIPTNGLSSQTWDVFRERVKHFVTLREEGMSSEYGFDSLRVSKGKFVKSATETPREHIRRVSWVPDNWIAKEHSTENEIVVIDGNFAWKFRMHQFPMRFDAREFNPKLGPLIAQAQIDAMKRITNISLESISPVNLWKTSQKTLRETHQIEWLSPADLNRDFASTDMLRIMSSTNKWWLTNR